MEHVLLALIALISGIVGALVGLGGGMILIPATLFISIELQFIPQITPQTVVGLSVVMMVFTGLSSTISYMKNKQVDFKSGWIFFSGSVPGTMLGAWINKGLDLPSFNLFFGVLLVFLSILLMIRDKLKPIQWFANRGKRKFFVDKEGHEYYFGYPIWFALLLSLIVGLISGLFGIGGGSILVPAMVLLFQFPPHIAVATSMFMVFLSSMVNSASHIYLGNVPWLYTIPVIIGAYVGAKIGAGLNKRMASKTVVFILQLVMLLIGIRSVLDGFF